MHHCDSSLAAKSRVWRRLSSFAPHGTDVRTPQVPEEVIDWFDRARVSLLAALDEKAGKKKSGRGEEEDAAQLVRSYVSQKLERRGLGLYAAFQRIFEAKGTGGDKGQDRGLALARRILERYRSPSAARMRRACCASPVWLRLSPL
jgi:hypothetical protein